MQIQLLSAVLALFLLGVFVPALRHKITSWPRFTASLQAYRLLPAGLTRAAAGLLAVLEAIVIVLLLLTLFINALQTLAFFGAGVLFSLYLLAMWVNMLRGRDMIDCGCGDEPTRLSIGLLVRNGVLVGLSLAGWQLAGYHDTSGSLGLLELVVSLALGAVALILYSAGEQMLTNRSTHRKLWMES
ncbi:MAG: MauE/DoxX family redox-associated membrane protein [Pseudomonadales bacterium]